MAIDRDSPIPIYHQLKTLIREKIEIGMWRPGDRIPTEHRLCQLYGISRSPVRQALNELTYEGLLIRRPGQGTFVSAKALVGPSPGTTIQTMSSDTRWSTILDRTADIWNAGHPSQKVIFAVDVVDHGQFYNLLSTAVGSGAAPDVALVDCTWVVALAKAGFLHPLDKLDPQWDQREFERSVHSPFIEVNTFDGRVYGLPAKADASLLWYRKDWFVREDLTPPQDWDDLLKAAQHFLQPKVQERYQLNHPLAFPGGTAGNEATAYNLMPFIWSAGGEIFDRDSVALDSPETRRALQFLRDLVSVYHVSPPDVVNYNQFTSLRSFSGGKVAMALGGSYESDLIRDATGWSDEEFTHRVGYVAPPAAPDNQPVSTVGGSSYVILRQCEHPILMMDVIKIATDPEIVGELYHSMLQNSPYPSFDALLSPESDPLLLQTSRMAAAGRVRPSIPEYVIVSRQLQAMFEATLSNSGTIQEITRRAAEFVSVVCERPLKSM